MSKENLRNESLDKSKSFSKEKEKSCKNNSNILSKHLKKVYPFSLHKTCSTVSLSSLSLTLSEKSCDSSLTDSSTTLDHKISLALRFIAASKEKRQVSKAKIVPHPTSNFPPDHNYNEQEEGLRRCNWITKTSDGVYVEFHDECWGVPVYDDHQLFELLALSGMLMDFNWTEILKRKESLRKVFAGFDPINVAKMGEKEIIDISTDKTLTLSETRVRCIVDNAKCILKVVKEFGSFSSYVWNYVNHKPVINKFRHPRNVPLRSPKAEAMSKDLQRHGFRFVGPVIVYSFMQAAGLSIDHLVNCYRYQECVNLAERPWRHV